MIWSWDFCQSGQGEGQGPITPVYLALTTAPSPALLVQVQVWGDVISVMSNAGLGAVVKAR